MIPLRSAFAGKYDLLQQLRNENSTFAEICRDYESLLAEIERRENEADGGDRHLSDLEDSLAGLKAELEQMIDEVSDSTPNQEI